MRTIKLTEETRKDLLEKLLKRSPNCYGEYEGRVTEIVNTVRAEGDKALFDYTERFDRAKITVENIRVTEDEIKTAYEEVDPELLSVIRKALVNIRSYHEKQLKQSWFESQPSGIILGQKVQALATVGVYVPGGKAVYPSSVLMNIVPAKVAGVEKIIMCTPVPRKERSAPPLWWPQGRPVLMRSTRPAALRPSPPWLSVRSLSRRWTRSWVPETSMWLLRKRPFTVS